MIFPENCTPHVVKWSSNPLSQGSLNAYLDVPRKLADEYTMMSPTFDVILWYCWWQPENPARKPVEAGSLSHDLEGFSTIPGGGSPDSWTANGILLTWWDSLSFEAFPRCKQPLSWAVCQGGRWVCPIGSAPKPIVIDRRLITTPFAYPKINGWLGWKKPTKWSYTALLVTGRIPLCRIHGTGIFNHPWMVDLYGIQCG